jgi:hypothetical protein
MDSIVEFAGKKYDISEFSTARFRACVAQYEALKSAVLNAKSVYLDFVLRSNVHLVAKELVDVFNIQETFCELRLDGVPVFFLPEVDLSPKTYLMVVSHKLPGAEKAYQRYCKLYGKTQPSWERFNDCEKLLVGFEKKNASFVLKYEVLLVVKDKELLKEIEHGP